jgi:hypothetical protein
VLQQEASSGIRHEGLAGRPPLRLRLEPSPHFAFLRGFLSGSEFYEEPICRRVGMAGLQDPRAADQARYYWLPLAESHLTQRLFGAVLGRIAALPSPAG